MLFLQQHSTMTSWSTCQRITPKDALVRQNIVHNIFLLNFYPKHLTLANQLNLFVKTFQFLRQTDFIVLNFIIYG